MTVEGMCRLVHVAYTDDPDYEEWAKTNEADPPWDGIAVYELIYGRDTPEEDAGEYQYTIHQRFEEGDHHVLEEGNGVEQNIWGWDGDRENPTLTPSFGHGEEEDGWRVHLHLTDGRIEPANDMLLDVVE